MVKQRLSALVCAALATAALAACGSSNTPAETITPPPGEIIGRIEVAADVPLGNCQVLLEGTPLGSRCDASGQFDIRNVPVGRWDLRVIPDPDGAGLPARRVAAASNAGFVTDIGALRLAPPGSVGGHIHGAAGAVPFAVISVPAYGVVTAPNANGGYLLTGVPPGVHEVVLTTDDGRIIKTDVTVLPTQTTIGVDFDLAQRQNVETKLSGSAVKLVRDDKGVPRRADDLSGMTVELVEILDGHVVTSTTTSADGRWEMTAKQGPYLVRLRDAAEPIQAIVPYVLLYREATELAQTLTLPPEDVDLDGDGAAQETDSDDDGDGSDDADDAFPLDPAEHQDVDGDGVGDHADLRTSGASVDDQTPTPDTDGDGELDFEDNCPGNANADQIDADADGAGNVCDNCPFIPNPDQKDSLGNGEGDACRSCIDGTSCTPANACEVGFLTCTTGGPVCATTGVALPNGDPCGQDMFCSGGTCNACHAGDTCPVPGNPCVQGVIECGTGVPVCAPTQVHTADGDPCGANQVCSSGVCVACTSGTTCTPAGALCHVGAIACTTGAPVCNDTGSNAVDGTGCGTNLFCNAGACVACPQGSACTPTNVCHAGHIVCGTGSAVCVDDGTPANDNGACGTGQFCQAGSCTSLPDSLVVQSGGGQSGNTGAQLGVVTLQLTNGGGQPISGRTVTFSAPPGGVVTPATGVSSANGLVQFTPRLPTSPGTFAYGATVAGAPPVSISETAVTPTPGVQGTIANVDHTTTGGEGLGGPAIAAHFNNPTGLAFAPDGSIYFIDQGLHRVKKIAADGTLTLVAGTGTPGASGDLGPATAATLNSPRDLALDAVGNVLYIADAGNNRVRAVNLTSGTISTYAGSGSMGDPFGDGGPASAANLSQPVRLALGPDRSLYISDSAHTRVRKVDVSTSVISTFVHSAGSCSASGPEAAITSCSFQAPCAMAFDSAGRLFVSAFLCGSATAGSTTLGILRVDADGSPHYVGGRASGITSDGVSVRATQFEQINALAFDAAGNLIYVDQQSDRVRRIDGATGLVTTIMGTGTAGSAADNVPASGQPVSDPESAVFTPGGDLILTELGTDSLRRISGAGTSTATPVTITVSGGDNQSTELARTTPVPLAVKVASSGNPVVGVTTEWDAVDPGAAVFGSPAATNPSGVASIGARVGLLPGPYHVRARFRDIHGVDVSGSPKQMTMNAVTPAAGTIYTAINTSHSAGADGFDGPATAAHIGGPRGVTVTSNGTIYVSDPTRVYEISPAGFLRVVAGNASSGFNGDFGTATSVNLSGPAGLAVDESTGTLYIADTNNGRIRGVDLASGSLFLVVGGGANVGPGFGDDGPGSAAFLSQPTSIAFNPADGYLYLGDQGHGRIRRVKVSSGVIEAFIDGGGCTGVVSLQNCSNTRCAVAVDSQGVYVAGLICGSGPVSFTDGVLRRNNDGSLTHIAGKSSGTNADNILAVNRSFPGELLGGISSDGTNVYFTISTATSKVMKVNLATNLITTLAGTGSASFGGEYGPASAAPLSSPADVFVANGNVYITDTSNSCVRVVE
jgi:sugar lactone lactonase YvrE